MNNNAVLSGNLKFLNLGDILQLLSTDNRTGELRIKNPAFNTPGIIYICDGNPVDAEAGDLTGKEAVYSLFGWLNSQFEFFLIEVSRPDNIKQRMMAIVLDALRELDEGIVKIFDVAKNSSKESVVVQKNEKGVAVVKGPSIEYGTIVDEDEFAAGDRIVTQGRHGNWLWVVLEGSVDIIKEIDEKEYKVLSSGIGAYIGGLSTLLYQDNNRSATVVARELVQLGVVDAQQLDYELTLLQPEFRKVLLSLDNRLRNITQRVAEIKNGSDKFDGLPKNVKPMIKQGDEVQKVFTILQGNAYIARSTDTGLLYLMKLKKGDFVGSLPFFNIDHEPSSASVFASEDLKLGIVDMEILQKDYDSLSVTIKNIIDYTTICISATTSLAGV